jgi:hypothetical protein
MSVHNSGVYRHGCLSASGWITVYLRECLAMLGDWLGISMWLPRKWVTQFGLKFDIQDQYLQLQRMGCDCCRLAHFVEEADFGQPAVSLIPPALINIPFINLLVPTQIQGVYVPFFETVISYLGGLLSAYALSREPILLSPAFRVSTSR